MDSLVTTSLRALCAQLKASVRSRRGLLVLFALQAGVAAGIWQRSVWRGLAVEGALMVFAVFALYLEDRE